MDSDKQPHIKRVAMSEEDAIFYRIKYGEEPTFRLEKVRHDDGPNELSEEERYVTYNLTNIPREEDD